MPNLNQEGTKRKPETDGVWPPPPTVPTPVPAQQNPFIVRLSLEMLILVDAGAGLVMSGISCLDRMLSHRPIYLHDVAIDGAGMSLILFVVHLWLRSHFRNRKNSSV